MDKYKNTAFLYSYNFFDFLQTEYVVNSEMLSSTISVQYVFSL